MPLALRRGFLMQPIDLSQQLRLWADELRAIANEGLCWSQDNPYMRRRFERVRRLAAAIFAAQDVRDVPTIEQLYRGELTHVAPEPCGDAAIFNRRGEMLLIQRKDNQLWAMPGGGFEVGETPAEAVSREAWEETGVEVLPVTLIGVYDSRFCGTISNAQLYHFVFLCRPRDPSAQPLVSNETLDVRWYSEDQLPPLSPGHAPRIRDAFRFQRGELREAVFDQC
jgi:8-oxo-dGTP pyrophosphatase MutT (NUDIX family)